MSMKRERPILERMAVWLAVKDARLKSTANSFDEIELEASELFLAQYDWYMERAARLWGRMQ